MKQEERWKTLAEADNALDVALVEWLEARRNRTTPQMLAALDDAAQRYTTGMAHVIGRPAAQRYARSLEAYRRATERHDALKTTLQAAGSMGAVDRKFL